MMKSSRACIFLFRLIAVATTLSAAIVMATSHETVIFFGINMGAKFQYTPSFVFFVIANAIAALYAFVTLFVPPSSSLAKQVIAMLVVAAVAAATSVGDVGKKGNKHAGWQPVCEQVAKFCNQVSGAVICGFAGGLMYMLIVLHTVLNPYIA